MNMTISASRFYNIQFEPSDNCKLNFIKKSKHILNKYGIDVTTNKTMSKVTIHEITLNEFYIFFKILNS